MHRGYVQANAGDLAAAVAYSALIALIPTMLLTLSVAGLFFPDRHHHSKETIYTSFWGLPSSAAGDAIQTVLTARRSSSWLGVISLAWFAWTGTGFVGCLSRSMNRIYGVTGCGYMCEKRRGFFVVLAFALLFMLALLASTIPTLFVRQDLPSYFQSWPLAAGWNQVLGYVIAFIATGAMFLMLYRVVPNAGQEVADVWPGTLNGALLFVIIAQVFPIYIRLLGGFNRYGAAFWIALPARCLVLGPGAPLVVRGLPQLNVPAPPPVRGAPGQAARSALPEAAPPILMRHVRGRDRGPHRLDVELDPPQRHRGSVAADFDDGILGPRNVPVDRQS